MMSVQTIWLVDDDADDCMLFEDAITEMGVTVAVVCVADGADLLNKLRQATVVPEIVFLDVNMPLKNGLDCLSEIKQDEQFKHLPVVMWSTSGQSETVEKAYRTGARLFMKKPHNFNKLKMLLHEVLQLNLETPVSLEDFLVGK
jgi:DNA-binding NtrC family response regulator